MISKSASRIIHRLLGIDDMHERKSLIRLQMDPQQVTDTFRLLCNPGSTNTCLGPREVDIGYGPNATAFPAAGEASIPRAHMRLTQAREPYVRVFHLGNHTDFFKDSAGIGLFDGADAGDMGQLVGFPCASICHDRVDLLIH